MHALRSWNGDARRFVDAATLTCRLAYILCMRIGPRHPRLGKAAFRLALPVLEKFCARRGIFRSSSAFAADRFKALRAKLDGGETVYLGGICASGTHNSGVALVAVSRDAGPKIICNNEEERF